MPQARLEAKETRNLKWQVLGWSYDLAMLVLAIGGGWLLVRRRATVAPLMAVVIGVTITAAVSNGNQRFRLAADPIMALGAAALIVAGIEVVAARRNAREGSIGGDRAIGPSSGV